MGKLSKTKDGQPDLEKLLAGFLDRQLQSISSPRQLAERVNLQTAADNTCRPPASAYTCGLGAVRTFALENSGHARR